MFNRGLRLGTLLLLPTLLGGCWLGVSYSSGDDDFCCADATGVWEGTVTESGVGTYAVTGLITGSQLRVFSLHGGPVFAGTFSITYDNLTATTTHYTDAIATASGSLTATVATRNWISGAYTLADGDSASLDLTYAPLTSRDSSLSVTDANWFVTDGIYSMSLAIDATGAISGSDSDGCVYTGQVNIIDPHINIYGIAITASSCGAANGTYSGHGTIIDTTVADGRLVFMVSNPGHALVRALDRT